MSLNPRDYDIAELRSMAGGEFAADPDAGGEVPPLPPGERAHRRRLARDLLTFAAAAGGDVERPYLDRLPASRAAEPVVFDWLDFLLTVGGESGARSALNYYERVGWLSASAREELEAYVDGFSATHRGGDGRLTTADHRESLGFVARLRAFDTPRRLAAERRERAQAEQRERAGAAQAERGEASSRPPSGGEKSPDGDGNRSPRRSQ